MNTQDQFNELDYMVRENSIKAQNLFERLQKLQECEEYSYTNISQDEIETIVRNIKKVKENHKLNNDEVIQTCSTIHKYLDSINETNMNKDVYKKNIEHTIELLHQKVNDICNTDMSKEKKVGQLYNYQLDHMRQIKKDIQDDYNNNCCDDITQIKNIIKEYYQRILFGNLHKIR